MENPGITVTDTEGPTSTLQTLSQSKPQILLPNTLQLDVEKTENRIKVQSSPITMETEINGGDLYCVPISYGKSKTTNTPCTQKSSEQDTKLNEVPKATWKKISRPGLPINREVTRDRVSVGKKRQAEHRAIKDGQDNKTSNKRLKGVAETTQPTSPTVVAVSQSRRSQ